MWLLFLGICFLPQPAHAELLYNANFSTYTSSYYVTQSDVSRDFPREVGEYMDRVYEGYGERLSPYTRTSRERFHIRVYQEKSAFQRFVGNDAVRGAFLPTRYLLCSYLGKNSKSDLLRSLRHEGLHQFMYAHITRESPPWLDEGLAEYFEIAMDEWGHFNPETLPEAHLATLHKALEDHSLLSLDELLHMQRSLWNTRLSHARSAKIQYAQAWSVVHFLLHGNGWEKRDYLDRYLKAIIEKKTGPEALKQVFGTDFAAFEKSWLSYVKDLISR